MTAFSDISPGKKRYDLYDLGGNKLATLGEIEMSSRIEGEKMIVTITWPVLWKAPGFEVGQHVEMETGVEDAE